MKMINTLKFHIESPEVHPSQYVKKKYLELSQQVNSKYIIYLDTRYWLEFRDVELGRNKRPEFVDLLSTIRSLVQNGEAICPISQETFCEIFSQQDPTTLSATVEIVDELSSAICMTEFSERLGTEFFYFMRKYGSPQLDLHDVRELIWTKCGYALGYSRPVFEHLSKELNFAIEKAIFDQMWSTSLIDMFQLLGPKPTWNKNRAVIETLNTGKFNHEHEFSTFDELFLIELRGILDTFESSLAGIMASMFEQDIGGEVADDDPNLSESGRMSANIIYESFKHEKIGRELGTLRVHALIHAAIRWDRKRKYKQNDLADFRHAAMAIPYSNLFLTEASLSSLVNQKNLNLNQFFECKTTNDPELASGFIKSDIP